MAAAAHATKRVAMSPTADSEGGASTSVAGGTPGLATQQSGPNDEPAKPKRRFAPQLEEASAKTHRGAPKRSSEPSNDTPSASAAPRRRFAPQLEETSVRSHHKTPETSRPQAEDARSPAKPLRRFAPQLEEVSIKSHKGGQTAGDSSKGPDAVDKPRRRFAPQLEETSAKVHRKAAQPSSTAPTATSSSGSSDRTRSRFAPQLIETAQRSRRRGDSGHSHHLQTDASPDDEDYAARRSKVEAPYARSLSFTEPGEAPESRFSYANLHRSRRSSVRKPTLECIHSSGSEDSKVPSLSHSPSANSDETDLYKHATRVRESCDERFAGYLLAHAARIAEKQLKEQAMVAYPNENLHEPVDHFAADRDSNHSGSDTGYGMLTQPQTPSHFARRESAAGWDASEMRRHREVLERQRLHNGRRDPAARREDNENDTGLGGPVRQPAELRQMRNAAKPPLLGGSIVFPKCPSPQLTRIDAYQKPHSRRNGPTSTASRRQSGLWTPGCPSPVLTRKNSGHCSGLWGGCCDAAKQDSHDLPSRLLQAGLLTPAVSTPHNELADPFATATPPSAAAAAAAGITTGSPARLSPFMATLHRQLPTTPPASGDDSRTDLPGIDAALSREAALDAEFPDEFVTQVYNYLSLGYPALGQRFDDELAKIARLPLEEIRRDDGRADARGFVGAPEGAGIADAPATREACGRWRALRLYIREWGRQEARMQEYALKPAAQPARRGSWLA